MALISLWLFQDSLVNESIKIIAGSNVILLGYQKFNVLKDHLARVMAFIFAAEEGFGIAPLEAQACGTPAIAFEKKGH